MRSEVVGLLAGAFSGLVVEVFADARRRRSRGVAATLKARRSRQEWESGMPAPRTSMRPRWEGALDPADEDDWLESMVVWMGSVGIAIATVATTWWLGTFVAFFGIGLALIASLLGVRHWIQHRDMPPGGRQVIVRGAAIATVSLLSLAWVPNTTHRGLTLDAIQDVVFRVKLTEQPGVLARDLDAEGLVLFLVLAAGITFAVAAMAMVVIDTLSLFAMTRLGEGGGGAFTGWLASFYPRRQARVWISTAAIAVLGLLLCTGTILRWYDEIRGT